MNQGGCGVTAPGWSSGGRNMPLGSPREYVRLSTDPESCQTKWGNVLKLRDMSRAMATACRSRWGESGQPPWI